MIRHIYGRCESLVKKERPHVFVSELRPYVKYLKTRMQESGARDDAKEMGRLEMFKADLLNGIADYKKLASHIWEESAEKRRKIASGLEIAEAELVRLQLAEAAH